MLNRDHQDVIANDIISQGYTIYGGYVYKKLINDDDTHDIDVHVKDNKDIIFLSQHLQKTFNCSEDKRYYTNYSDEGFRLQGLKLSCPFNMTNYYVDFILYNKQTENDIFKLEYKQVNNHPQIVYKGGTQTQADKIIKELKQKRFTPWLNMRNKDKLYFSHPQWVDMNTYNYKIKKYIGLYE